MAGDVEEAEKMENDRVWARISRLNVEEWREKNWSDENEDD